MNPTWEKEIMSEQRKQDCFFASVAIRSNPMLTSKPVVVAHSNVAHGTSSVASASYEARKYGRSTFLFRQSRVLPFCSSFTGISNGMMVGQARELCPDLVALPYEFDKYEQASALTPHGFPALRLPPNSWAGHRSRKRYTASS